MFTDGTLSLKQCIYVLLVQSFYLLWIFKQGTGNYILDFCFCRIRKLISFRKHKITCIFKSGQGGLLASTIKTQRSRSFKTQEVVVYKYFVGGCVPEQSRSVGLFCSIIVV